MPTPGDACAPARSKASSAFKIQELIFQLHLLPSLGLDANVPELHMADGIHLHGIPALMI